MNRVPAAAGRNIRSVMGNESRHEVIPIPESQPILRSEGLTPAERYLKRLSEQTFLSLWCYANPYREPGKELCDLLIVFGDHIVIFSDKNCRFTSTGDMFLDWGRWFRRGIKKSAKQIWGAERWIREFPNRIFLDSACVKPFPYPLPEPKKVKFYLVTVAHDIARHSTTLFGGSGSLMIRSDIKGFSQHFEPFTIGDLDPTRTLIHIFDDTALNILMQTLDTISDFVSYLQKKENLLRSGRQVFAAGEEELLAIYLKNLNANGEHDFVLPVNHNRVAVLEGHWENFQKNPQRLAQVETDKVSYFWDYLIEEFNRNALARTSEYTWPPSFDSSEKVMRFLAAQPRFIRRMLAEGFLEIMRKTPPNQRMLRVVPPWRDGDPYFVFLIFPFRQDRPYEQNRLVRRSFLEACCRVVKLKYPDAVDIVGIATESGRMERGEGSEDACYLDTRIWTEENEREARELQSNLGILVSPNQRPIRITEYPEPSSIPAKFVPRVGRNDRCPCGSGKKYKKCHGMT